METMTMSGAMCLAKLGVRQITFYNNVGKIFFLLD